MFWNVTCDGLEPCQALIRFTPSHMRAGSLGYITVTSRQPQEVCSPAQLQYNLIENTEGKACVSCAYCGLYSAAVISSVK